MNTEIARTPTSGLEALPASAEPRGWTPQQFALMQFAGLAREIMRDGSKVWDVVDRPVAEAFLAVCRRTGLDPLARQIYAMLVSGKWSIVVGVDGFRIIAQRSKGYRGQIGPQWATGRKVTAPMLDAHGEVVFNRVTGEPVLLEQDEWVDAWLPESLGLEPENNPGDKGYKGPRRPVAARIGILREGFAAPLWQVVAWDEFGIEPRFRGDNWEVRPAHMLGIRAETHGLRRTFPNDLSGLYTPEDFDGIEQGDEETAKLVKSQIDYIEKVEDTEELTRYFHELNPQGMADVVRAAFMARGGVLKAREDGTEPSATATEPAQGAPETVEAVVVDAEPTKSSQIADSGDARPDSVARSEDDPDFEPWLARLAAAEAEAEMSR